MLHFTYFTISGKPVENYVENFGLYYRRLQLYYKRLQILQRLQEMIACEILLPILMIEGKSGPGAQLYYKDYILLHLLQDLKIMFSGTLGESCC